MHEAASFERGEIGGINTVTWTSARLLGDVDRGQLAGANPGVDFVAADAVALGDFRRCQFALARHVLELTLAKNCGRAALACVGT